MSRVLLACVMLLAVAVSALPRSYETYNYESYQAEFKKAYTSQVVMQVHRATFEANLAKIKQINADYAVGKSSWYAAVNKFTDLSEDEMRLFKGHMKGARTASLPANLKVTDLPASVDWRTKNMTTPVKDQGGCGSCWTFSATESLESHIAIKTGQLMVFSEQQIVSCATNPNKCGGTGGCEGATQEIAFNYTRDAGGISLESSYPYQGADSPCDASSVKPVATIDGYIKLDANNATQLQAAIANAGPIAISVAAGGLFQLYGGGVFNTNGACGWDIDHAVVAEGYGVDASSNLGFWLVRNSWGGFWGEAGYIRLFRKTDGSAELCGTDTTPGDGDGCPGGPSSLQVCGECGVLSDSSYPFGGRLV